MKRKLAWVVSRGSDPYEVSNVDEFIAELAICQGCPVSIVNNASECVEFGPDVWGNIKDGCPPGCQGDDSTDYTVKCWRKWLGPKNLKILGEIYGVSGK